MKEKLLGLFDLKIIIGGIILITFACSTESIIPNDPFFKYQVSFYNNAEKLILDRVSYKKSPIELNPLNGIHLNILTAWEITTGSSDTIVAVMDDGFFYKHEDIKDNIWQNPGETGLDQAGYPKDTNGIDDDDNGYVDDVIGYDFYFNDPDPDCYVYYGKLDFPIALYQHSNPALGIIGAKGNNRIGVAGINWNVSLMLLKIHGQGSLGLKDPTIRIQKAAEAIRYAVDNGARVINWSGFVSSTDSEKLRPLKEAIDYAEENKVLLVNAAGNSKKDIDIEENFSYPSCFQNENILVVGEIDFEGNLYVVEEGSIYIGGSNYGEKNVDITAIAQNYSTGVRHNLSVYRLSGGTSNSAPVATGVIALIFSIRPDLNGFQVKKILMDSATKLPGLKGKIKCGGMVNAFEALKLAQQFHQSK
jgi:subtilisin family serine protease